jgi:hypothetical protein
VEGERPPEKNPMPAVVVRGEVVKRGGKKWG